MKQKYSSEEFLTCPAGYYSYLYAKAFSSELWAQYFAADPLNCEAGEMLRRDILQYGGAKNPTTILRDVLGEHSVKETSSGGIVPSTRSMMTSFTL
jgi:intermediate peptidase